MNERLNESLRRLFDGELDPSEAGRVLRDAADDDEALALLNLEFRMQRRFGEEQRAAWVPDGFSDRVMKQVQLRASEAESPRLLRGADAESPRLRTMFRSWLNRLRDALILPQPVVLRPAYVVGAVVVLALGIVLVLSGRISTLQQAPDGADDADRTVAVGDASRQQANAEDDAPLQQTSAADAPTDQVLVPFVYVGTEASSVAVAGDFNDWEPTGLQRKELNGRVVWTGHIPIPRGEHRYMFVVNGSQWESDPLAPVHRDDGFGNTNAILAL